MTKRSIVFADSRGRDGLCHAPESSSDECQLKRKTLKKLIQKLAKTTLWRRIDDNWRAYLRRVPRRFRWQRARFSRSSKSFKFLSTRSRVIEDRTLDSETTLKQLQTGRTLGTCSHPVSTENYQLLNRTGKFLSGRVIPRERRGNYSE